MKTYNSTLMALIFIMGLSACDQGNTKHQELLNWLDSNQHTFSLDTEMSEDSAIIRVLASVSNFNEQVSNSSDTVKGDAVDYLEQAEEFDNYLSNKTPITRRISLDSANMFYNFYIDARATKDRTEAILLSFPQFMQATTQAFRLQGIDWSNPSVWPSKSFLIYPSNYGSVGRGPSHSDKFQTSAILQFANEDLSTPAGGDWIVLANELYNFGDMKPPIVISNPKDGPKPFQTLVK